MSWTLRVLLWTKKIFYYYIKGFFSFKSFCNSHYFLSLYNLFVYNIFLGNITLATTDSFWRLLVSHRLNHSHVAYFTRLFVPFLRLTWLRFPWQKQRLKVIAPTRPPQIKFELNRKPVRQVRSQRGSCVGELWTGVRGTLWGCYAGAGVHRFYINSCRA